MNTKLFVAVLFILVGLRSFLLGILPEDSRWRALLWFPSFLNKTMNLLLGLLLLAIGIFFLASS